MSESKPPQVRHPEHVHERHVPFLELLEIQPLDAGHGWAAFELTIAQKHLRTLGLLHGGVTATLLDTALGYAAVTTSPPGHFVVTMQLNMNFIRPGWEGERLVARGDVIHSGRQTAVARGEIRTGDGVLMASATATFMYIPQPGDLIPKSDDPVATSAGHGPTPADTDESEGSAEL